MPLPLAQTLARAEPSTGLNRHDASAADPALLEAARAFEAVFIAEMLKHAGVGNAPDGFGGGVGEEQFAGLLQEAQARDMARAGGIGLAEYIVASLEGVNNEQ